MNATIRRIVSLMLCLCALFSILPTARASETPAQEISSRKLITAHSRLTGLELLFDHKTLGAVTIPERSWITLEHTEGIGSVYLTFDVEYAPFTITNNDTGESRTFGQHAFLHEFAGLEEAFGYAPKSVTIYFTRGKARLSELQVFSAGKTPEYVQKWKPAPVGKTDLILFSTHGDDEQLFFAGMLPYYAAEMDYEVLVAYFTCHRGGGSSVRCHEMLDGLWAVGITNYPVLGPFLDFYSSGLSNAYYQQSINGQTKESMMAYVVEQLRKYKPQVAIGHDLINGEYGHGQHMLYADLLCSALEAANDPAQYPELAKTWGTWDVPKTYLHLWPENQIVMNWDVPLSSFGGMTAYEVTKYRGFPCHQSQAHLFSWYLDNCSTAAEIKENSPCEFGLYRSTVGPDEAKNDFFEHVTPYRLQDSAS